MNSETWNTLRDLVETSLDEADAIWNEVGCLMEKRSMFSANAAEIESRIPGHRYIVDGQPKVDDFLALAVDLRDSTNHLTQAISSRITEVTEEHRLFCETSALLPVAAMLVDKHDGRATEYPGDGVLGLFNVTNQGEDQAIYSAYAAAADCIRATAEIINPALEARYSLPPIAVGVGMGRSRAIVTAVGYAGFRQPRVVGKCVYYATKLSKGKGEIWVDTVVRKSWPKKDGGPVRFRSGSCGGVEGFCVFEENG